MPPWQRQSMLLFRADCLMGAAHELAQAGDTVMAMQMIVWAKEAIKEARQIEEKAVAQ
jgi:aspartate 1-decarboxylase